MKIRVPPSLVTPLGLDDAVLREDRGWSGEGRDIETDSPGDSGKSWAAERASSSKRGTVSLMHKASNEGLWDNIHKKRERGEPPAKPGDEDYPDEETWQKLTADGDPCWDGYERVPGTKKYEPGSCRKKSVRVGARISYYDDMQHFGQIDLSQVRCGDHVVFQEDHDGVEAGALGRIVKTDANSGVFEVEARGRRVATDGTEIFGLCVVQVKPSMVALRLSSDDHRVH